MDLSNASKSQWKHYQDSAIELALTLLPGDKKYAGYLVGYSNEAEVMVDTTTDSDKIVEKLRNIPFFSNDKGGLNINQVRTKARVLRRRHGLLCAGLWPHVQQLLS